MKSRAERLKMIRRLTNRRKSMFHIPPTDCSDCQSMVFGKKPDELSDRERQLFQKEGV